MSKIIEVEEGIYYGKVCLFIGPHAEFKQWANTEYCTNIDQKTSLARGLCTIANKDKQTYYIIWLPQFDYNSIDDIGVLDHELIHVAISKMTQLGEQFKVVSERDENVAYYHSYLLRSFLTKLKDVDPLIV